jgi:putative phosphoribosyl transferase
MSQPSAFSDRHQAGQALANVLRDLQLHDPVVLALPRGGVPVGHPIARALGAPLDVLLVRSCWYARSARRVRRSSPWARWWMA